MNSMLSRATCPIVVTLAAMLYANSLLPERLSTAHTRCLFLIDSSVLGGPLASTSEPFPLIHSWRQVTQMTRCMKLAGYETRPKILDDEKEWRDCFSSYAPNWLPKSLVNGADHSCFKPQSIGAHLADWRDELLDVLGVPE